MIKQVNRTFGIIICMVGIAVAMQSDAAKVVPGDADNSDKTFSCPMEKYVQSSKTGAIYIAAKPDRVIDTSNDDSSEKDSPEKNKEDDKELQSTIKNAALMHYKSGDKGFTSIAPEKVNINLVVDENGLPIKIDNPIFDQGIRHLALLEKDETIGMASHIELPIVVTEREPNRIYLFEYFGNADTTSMLSADLFDVTNRQAKEIVAITPDQQGHIFAAIAPHEGEFGQKGTSVAVLTRGFSERQIPEQESEDNQNNNSQLNKKYKRIFGQESAFPIGCASPSLAIEDDLSFMSSVVDMHWDARLHQLYIGLHVRSGESDTAGARAVVVGRFDRAIVNGQAVVVFRLFPIVSDDAVTDDDDYIIGARGSKKEIAIHQVRSLYTTGCMPYLIVLGGVGSPEDTKNKVFALPLTTGVRSHENGMIAAKDGVTRDRFRKGPGKTTTLISRDLTNPALTPDQMTTASDEAAQVGGGALSAGPIERIFVHGDTVFACVSGVGLFYSQAILNQEGKIKSWTAWKPAVLPTEKNVKDVLLSTHHVGNALYMIGNDQKDAIDTIKYTHWVDKDDDTSEVEPFICQINDIFDGDNDGIVYTTHFSPVTPGVGDNYVSLFAGKNRLVIAHMARSADGAIVPHDADDFSSAQHYDNGIIDSAIASNIVSVSGGVLHDIGSITSAEIVVDTVRQMAWLCVSGKHGVAILSDKQGNGWDIAAGFDVTPMNVQRSMSFKRVGEYGYVKKLLYDNGFLYLLTGDLLDRVKVEGCDIGNGVVQPIAVAKSKELLSHAYGGFLDVIVSGPFALLGTTNGLFQVAAGDTITSGISSTDIQWQPVHVPEGLMPAVSLIPVTKTGRSQDLAVGAGGYVYLLSAYQANKQSRINRLAVKGAEGDQVPVNAVMPFRDMYAESVLSYFIDFDGLKNNFVTDGAFYLSLQDKGYKQESCTILSYPVGQYSFFRFSGHRGAKLELANFDSSRIISLARSATSGHWMVVGNRGLLINQ